MKNIKLTDEILISYIKEGGEKRELAISTLYRQLYSSLKAYLIIQGCPSYQAEECLQDTFIKVIRKIDQFRGDSSLNTWVHSIMQNTWRDHLRNAYESKRSDFDAHKYEQIEEDFWLRPDAIVESDGLRNCVYEGLQTFQKQEAEHMSWILRLVNGASIAELAQDAGRSVGAMREYLSQCRKKLRPFIHHCLSFLEP
ncbi:RNA polymerase sigma factor [Marinomonas aquiplantarum]|uniref:RNA polymerase sigma factor (Sigma-70 family) n=1 Tax=Marinomonas aquiplantarum TaxID=491951 RepID=A0A366CT69_9GAMM|nr:RNA polymerase sigma factor [Marinomonas aquiplantarum]RBO78334.1 RNA polymerase sigma factor (sigma-70 family) [Marinomonas aquiplantarum]